MTEPALRYRRVDKRFGERVALDDVSFEVGRGEVFGLLGPNGAGKTTLIRLALDILRPDGGEVEVLGRPVKRADHDRIAYLPEERGLYRDERVIDVLAYLARLKGASRADAKARAAAWLERVGLAEVARRKVEQLSKGMGQKVQVAAALVSNPELAILDEPFSGLDPIHVEQVIGLIEERRAAGRTTILSTHLMNRVEDVCDRVVFMSQGRAVLEGTLDAIRAARAAHEVWLELDGGALPEVDGVVEATAEGDSLRVRHDPEVSPAELLARLMRAGARVRRFEPARASVEQIFKDAVREAAR